MDRESAASVLPGEKVQVGAPVLEDRFQFTGPGKLCAADEQPACILLRTVIRPCRLKIRIQFCFPE